MRAARHAAPLLAAVGLAAIGLAGCGRFSDYAKVAEGNRLHERGDYQGAIVSYLAARRGPAKDFAAVIDYDVANVYARLGEYKAATDLYAAARSEGGKALVADVVIASEKRGTAFGLYNAAVGISALPASFIAGLLWQKWGPAAPFLFGAGLSLVSVAALAVLLRPRRPAPAA